MMPVAPSPKIQIKIQQKQETMAENNSTAPVEEDLFDDAQEEFPGKEDLKDRLVAIWVTGKHGMRKGDGAGARPYPWYETVTLVLDDGPNWNGTKIVDGESKPNLVPSVAENGAQRLTNFQFTQGGLTARLEGRVNVTEAGGINGSPVLDKPKTFRPMLGRINSRKNKIQGRSASWSISEPTADDKVIARKFNAELAAISKEMEAAGQKADEADEFDD